MLVKVSPIEKRMIGRSELWGIRRHLTDEGGGSRLVTPVCPNIEVRYIYTIAEQCELERVGGWREGDTLVQKVGGGDPALHFITLHYTVIITLHFIALHYSVIISLHFITLVCIVIQCHYIGRRHITLMQKAEVGGGNPTLREYEADETRTWGEGLLQEYEECDKYDENDMMEVFDVDGRTETHTGYIENIFCSM